MLLWEDRGVGTGIGVPVVVIVASLAVGALVGAGIPGPWKGVKAVGSSAHGRHGIIVVVVATVAGNAGSPVAVTVVGELESDAVGLLVGLAVTVGELLGNAVRPVVGLAVTVMGELVGDAVGPEDRVAAVQLTRVTPA